MFVTYRPNMWAWFRRVYTAFLQEVLDFNFDPLVYSKIFQDQNGPFKLVFAAIFHRQNQMTWYFGFGYGSSRSFIWGNKIEKKNFPGAISEE